MTEAWLVVNAFLRGGSFNGMENAFINAARKAGVHLEIKTNADFLGENALASAPGCALFFDKDLALARRLEDHGLRLFNRREAIAVCDDKTLTSLVLSKHQVQQPLTLLCPMTYPGLGYGDFAFLGEAADRLGFPLVVKEGKGSFGKQVYLVHSYQDLKVLVERLGAREILFQQFVSESAGRDLRLYVVGNEVVASIQRVNQAGDFRANLENGATAMPYTPTREENELAVKASIACGTDFAGIDLLQSKDGPLVCEVNSNAHFLGLRAATGVDPAVRILDLIKAEQ